MRDNIKLFLLADRYGDGGVEQVLMRYAEALEINDPTFISFGGFSDGFLRCSKSIFPKGTWIDLRKRSILSLLRFYWFFKNNRPDLCIAGVTYSNVVVSVFSHMFRKTLFIASVHGQILNSYGLWEVLKKRVLYGFISHSVLTLVVSFRNKEILTKLVTDSNKIKYVRSWSLPPNDDLPRGAEPQVFFCGRLEPDKNPEMCLRLFQRSKFSQNTTLHFFGDGRLKESLINMVKEMGLDKRVVFRGIVHNWQCEITLNTVLLLTSIHEAFGLVVSEILNAGGIAVVPAWLLPEFSDYCNTGRIRGYIDENQCVKVLDDIFENIPDAPHKLVPNTNILSRVVDEHSRGVFLTAIRDELGRIR